VYGFALSGQEGMPSLVLQSVSGIDENVWITGLLWEIGEQDSVSVLLTTLYFYTRGSQFWGGKSQLPPKFIEGGFLYD
jgi:hypothetical protein